MTFARRRLPPGDPASADVPTPARLGVKVLLDPPRDRSLDDRVRITQATEASLHAHEAGIEWRTRRARFQVRLDGGAGLDIELAIEIQDYAAPAWARASGGCRLAHDVVGTVRAAGFTVLDERRRAGGILVEIVAS